jgi:hypothetical protein
MTKNNILKKGELISSQELKGHVSFKKIVRDKKNKETHMIYFRLEDGKEFTIDNIDLYLFLNIGDLIYLRKDVYSHKSGRLISYFPTLDDALEKEAIYTEIYYID